MTNEEAIEILTRITNNNFYGGKVQTACKLAIEALSEPSLPSNLDEAAIIYINTTRVKSDKDKVFNEISRNHEYLAFKAGAEWMAQKEKSYSPWLAINGLKDAAIDFGEFAKAYEIGGQSFEEDMAVAFTRGAEWDAGQGETIEGEVVKDINNNLCVTAKGFSGKEAKFGDKVVVQIRKK